jgi:diadenylate cyclase
MLGTFPGAKRSPTPGTEVTLVYLFVFYYSSDMGNVPATIFSNDVITVFNLNWNIADLIDVIIITLLVYTAIFLFKQTRSLRILAGIGILLLLYIFAQLFQLDLTLTFLRYFFGFFLVIFVVVFQEELRKFFEMITLVSTRQKKSRPLAVSSPASNAVLQAMAYFAHERIGALLVFSGEEQIKRYLEGGEMLDGVITEDVIISIFDPTSPGHDGAMIINKNRIEQFGVHLPLSNNFREIGKHGTRHSAALGLAERTDAFIIVVSEERGTVEQLETALNKFLKEKFVEDRYSSWNDLIVRNTGEKFIAVALALLLKLLS